MMDNPDSLVPDTNTTVNSGTSLGIDQPRLPEDDLFPEIAPNVSKDIADEVDSYFARIYNHPHLPTLSIDGMLDMLEKFRDSSSTREREVLNCMLRKVFKEYQSFRQYHYKKLHITAQLFGGIIERGLISGGRAVNLALCHVVDELRKPEGSKMYNFGITALDSFKSRLKEYRMYCERIRAISHFSAFPPHLIEYVEYGSQSLEPPNKPEAPVPPASTMPSTADATDIVILPCETIQDKIAFIFNNLCQLNLQRKCDELRDLVSNEHWPWISMYLVKKRAASEPNFHSVYSSFLDTLKSKEVLEMVTKETFRNIKVLLGSDKVVDNSSARSRLKNLGHWLGMLTLGRNIPILEIDLDLNELLIVAYQKGQQELSYVVPFVVKVLESCANSKVFKPPNPWTMGIMNILAEVHQNQNLKLALQFEIDILCKKLDIDVKQLKPAVPLLPQPSAPTNLPLGNLNEPELAAVTALPEPRFQPAGNSD